MIEIGVGVVLIGFIICIVKYISPWIRIANELKAKQKTKNYWFEDWE